MFSLNEDNRYLLSSTPTDMRIGVNGMYAKVRLSGSDPTCGKMFVFVGKGRRLMKLLYWDRDGYAVYDKRFESGRFSPTLFPLKSAPSSGSSAGTSSFCMSRGYPPKTKRRNRFQTAEKETVSKGKNLKNSRNLPNVGAFMLPGWRRILLLMMYIRTWCLCFLKDSGRQRSNGEHFSENKNIGLLQCKHPYFWGKTSVLLFKEVRCFSLSEPLTRSPLHLFTKKVFENLLHFLHHGTRCPVFADYFGWRIGCRMLVQGVVFMRVCPTLLPFPLNFCTEAMACIPARRHARKPRNRRRV